MAYGEIDTSDAANAGLFAVPALFITFRETLEAAIIISVLLGLLEKLNLHHMKRMVWFGVLMGVFVSLLISIIFIVAINLAKESLLENSDDKHLVEGIMSIIAAVLIGVVAVTLGNIMAVHDKWEGKLSSEIGKEQQEKAVTKKSIVMLAFTAVVREGLETLIFFTGIAAAYPPESLPIPAVVGAVVGTVIGIALYRFGSALTIRIFFQATMILLVFIGAGVFGIGIAELQSTGAFGTWTPEEERAGLLTPVFDIRECCALENSEFWVFLRVLFGYSPNPTGLEMLTYFLYHIVVWTIIFVKYWWTNNRGADTTDAKIDIDESPVQDSDDGSNDALQKI